MEQTKENLINSLIVSLADNTNLSISELKEKLQMELYDWNVTKVTGKCAKAHSFRSGMDSTKYKKNNVYVYIENIHIL